MKNKIFKRLFTSIASMTALASIAVAAIHTTSCTTVNTSYAISNSNSNQIEYANVVFDDLDGKVTIEGESIVKARVGRTFASVKVPIARISTGQRFK